MLKLARNEKYYEIKETEKPASGVSNMRLLIIRHGDPDYAVDGLTEQGKKEVELLADRLYAQEKIDAFYVSTYGRARLTARPTLEKFKAQATICDWLHEFDTRVDWGEDNEAFLSWDLLPRIFCPRETSFQLDHWWEIPPYEKAGIKEAYDHVNREMDKVLSSHGYDRKDNYYEARENNTKTLAFFCHFGLEVVLLSHLLNISPVPLWQGTIALPTGITELITEEREKGIAYFRMNRFGDVAHLTMNGLTPSFSGRFCEIYEDFSQRH